MRIFCSLLIMICVGVAACGESGDSSADTTPTSAKPSTSATTTSPTPSTTSADDDLSIADAASSLDAVDSVVVTYCEAALETETRVAAADFTDPVEVEDSVRLQFETLDALEVPEVIETEIKTLLDAIDRYYVLLETVEFDYAAIEDEVLNIFGDPDVARALATLDKFDADNCPLALDGGFEPDENPLGLTEADVLVLLADPNGREGIAEGIVSSTGITLDGARCFLDTTDPTIVAALFSIGVGDQTQVDPEVAGSIFEAFATCGLPSDAFG
jgi:hypothetical protein